MKSALQKTGSYLGSRLRSLFASPLTPETYEQLQHILYEAHLGASVTEEMIEKVKTFLKKHPGSTTDAILEEMKQYAHAILSLPPNMPPPMDILTSSSLSASMEPEKQLRLQSLPTSTSSSTKKSSLRQQIRFEPAPSINCQSGQISSALTSSKRRWAVTPPAWCLMHSRQL